METIKKIFYINLDRSEKRKSVISKHLSKFDIPFERFKAIDGNELQDTPKYSKFVKARHRTEIELLKFIKNLENGLYLINEDDILIEDKFFEKLNILLEEVPDDWQVLKIGIHTLYNSKKYKIKEIDCEENLGGKKYIKIHEPMDHHVQGKKISQNLYKLENGLLQDYRKNLGNQCYIIRHINNNIESIINNLEKLPLDHIDHNYNKIMNIINIYGTEINNFIFFKEMQVETTIHLPHAITSNPPHSPKLNEIRIGPAEATEVEVILKALK